MSTGVTLLRQLEPEDVVCNAGTLIGDANIRCGIEESTIIGHRDPTTVEALCCGEYTRCTSWVAEKVAADAGLDLRKQLKAQVEKGARQRTAKALREARLRQAQRLLTEDSRDGRALRRRLQLGEYAKKG